MDDQRVDASWLTTQPVEVVNKTRGLDTVNRINALLKYSHCRITVFLTEREFLVKSVAVCPQAGYLQVNFVNSADQESTVFVPWYTRFALYLGERF